MTGLLASVTSVAEAEIALTAGADIIDLKDPGSGALGALPDDVIRAAARALAGRRLSSATVGDLPMQPRRLVEAASRIASLGVDFVKVGFFPTADPAACIAALATEVVPRARIVAVLFADRNPDFRLIAQLHRGRFAGAMLDTADKRAGGLRRHLDDRMLRDFIGEVQGRGMTCGLAGSLGLDDIPPLLRLAPDYLGFRGALCRAGRASELDAERIGAVRAAIDRSSGYQPSAASMTIAAAGAQRAAHSRVGASPSIRSAKST
jgi:dihydroneopterin aldolase